MTTRISFPSVEFPAPVSVSLDLPDGWIGKPISGAILAAVKPGAPNEFTPNVVITSSRFDGDYRIDSAIAAVQAKVEETPDVVVLGSEQRDIAGSPGFRIEFSFVDARVGTLVQAVRVAVVPNGEVTDLITVTGSASGTQAQTMWPELRAVQESLTVTAGR